MKRFYFSFFFFGEGEKESENISRIWIFILCDCMSKELFVDIFCHCFDIKMSKSKHKNKHNTQKCLSKNNASLYFSGIGDECFGVFVTIERDDQINDKKNKNKNIERDDQINDKKNKNKNIQNKKRVHGCIGRINFEPPKNYKRNNTNGFQCLSPAKLYDYCLDAASSAIFKDIRKANFSLDISYDPFADIKISFMLLPVDLMNENHPNNKYGLICVSEDGQTTTFLPDVFPDKKLSDIKQDLLMKAGTGECRSWIEYQTTVKSCNFYEIMFILMHRQKKALEIFVEKYFEENSFIFYSIDAAGNFGTDEREIVRNLACIYTLNKLSLQSDTKKKLMANYDFYFKDEKKMVTGVQKMVAVNRNRNKDLLCQGSILDNITDLDFTLGQFGIYISKHCPNQSELDELVFKKLEKRFDEVNSRDDFGDVFFLNWFAQFVFHSIQIKNEAHQIVALRIVAKKIMEKLFSLIKRREFVKQDTNFLAVSFEALCHLVDSRNPKGVSSNAPCALDIMCWSRRIFRYIFHLFIHLEKRIQYDCLFSFIDESIRLDISCHVWNGILILMPAFGKFLSPVEFANCSADGPQSVTNNLQSD